MTAKEYMKQAKILLRRIDRKQKEADALTAIPLKMNNIRMQ